MNRKRMHQDIAMERPAIARVLPIRQIIEPEPMENGETSWFRRRMSDLGVLVMGTSQPGPPELRINVATVGMWIAIFAAIGTISWWTWQRADAAGYERGRQEATIEQLKERTAAAEAKANDASAKSLYAISKVDGGDGHANTNRQEQK